MGVQVDEAGGGDEETGGVDLALTFLATVPTAAMMPSDTATSPGG